MGVPNHVDTSDSPYHWDSVHSLSDIRAGLVGLSGRTGSVLSRRGNGRTSLSGPIRRTDATTTSVGRIEDLRNKVRSDRNFCACGMAHRFRGFPRSAQAGSILIQAIALIPLVITVLTIAAAAQIAIRKKLRAQALCVSAATRLQYQLRETLIELTRLNPRATQLRVQRTKADHNLAQALASGNPYAIAAAKAVQTAVILAQTALRGRQQSLLLRAGAERRDHERQLESASRGLPGGKLSSRTYFVRALAVQPIPAGSLSPDYVPVAPFTALQRHEFRFDVNLGTWLTPQMVRQTTVCSASLRGKEKAWTPVITTASAQSRPP